MSEFYWDDGNGVVTKDSSYAPIIEGTNIYIETYDVLNHGDNKRISIAYTEGDKQNVNMYYYRQSILEQHGLSYSDLGRLLNITIPKEKYSALKETKEET